MSETWTTRDGTVIPIADMETSHLYNAIKFLERRSAVLLDRYQWSMALGPTPSGEMAMDAFESAFDELLETTPVDWLREQPKYQALCAEMGRRIEEANERTRRRAAQEARRDAGACNGY